VLPITDTDTTFLEWYGEFDCEEAVLDEVTAAFGAIYSEFIADLRTYLRAGNRS
jgi:hypothetical protein